MTTEDDELTKRITAAVNAGVERARKIHQALGLPMVIWLDGRPQWVDATTLEPVPPPYDRKTA